MSRYRVAFDGKWQDSFRDRAEALEWARAVGDTGRLVYVVRSGFRSRLVAVFPDSQAEEGERLWNAHRAAGASGGHDPGYFGP